MKDAIIHQFAAGIAEICSHGSVAPDRALRWTIITNPIAGGFTIPSRWKLHNMKLKDCIEKARRNPRRVEAEPSATAKTLECDSSLKQWGMILTKGSAHACSITEALIHEALSAVSSPSKEAPFYLIITAGGDGTSLEVLKVLYKVPAEFRSNFAVLRLPMGTGNDGADAGELDKALDLLIYPSSIELTRAVRLTTSDTRKEPFYAFNILSVGLDAFVTHMTNKIKGNFPGDSYKLWVDIAALLYDRLYKVGSMQVQAFDETKNRVKAFRENVLLLAVGVSGHRTYGSHKRILPDERNVCAVKQMSLFRKVALKGLFTSGEHIDKPESILFNAHRVEFQGEHPILAQMDGETVLLQPQDFPAVIELTEPAIPVLKRRL